MAVGAMRLDWGALDLVGADGGYDTFTLSATGEDLDFGEPQPIEVTVATLMGDGVRTDLTHYENREIAFRVVVQASDAGGLADGEAALDALVGSRTTLTWQPPDDFGPATVFDVETSRKRFLFSDLDEVRNRKQRTFQITLNCLPFGRSSTPVTIGAEFVAATVAIADDCESTTGWSASGDPANNPVAVAVDSSIHATGTGSLKFTPTGSVIPTYGTARYGVTVARTGLSIDASGGGYFVVRVRLEWGWGTDPQAANITEAYLTTTGGGRQAVSVLTGEVDAGGFRRLSFAVPNASTITGFEVKALQWTASMSLVAAPHVWVDSLGLAGNSSAPQNVMSFDVLGSMRSEASFQVSAPAGLGDVLLYTCPDRSDGFRPDLRRWQTAGGTSTDATAINGSHTTPLGTGAPAVFEAPQSSFRAGAYALMARLGQTGAGNSTVTVTAQTKIGSTLVGQVYTTSLTFDLPDTAYHVLRLGVLDLPPLVTDPASNAVTVFTVTAFDTTVHLDELLVFPLEDAALTWVECGSGAPSATVASRLWIDAPSSALPRGARLKGNDVTRLDAQYAPAKSRGRHLLVPGKMLAYLLTSAAGGADLEVTHFPKSHTNNAYAGS